jgi:hypothetical protein
MKKRGIHIWKLCIWALTGIVLIAAVIGQPGLAIASDKTEAQAIVDKSKGTLTDLMNDDI